MTLKNPSDFFDEGKKESIIDKLVERPELKSFSDAFNVYKENISKFEDLSETLKNIESIQSDIKDFIKKEDLDNAVVSYAFLLEETVSKLKNDVTSINEKHLIKIRSNVTGLSEKINNFVEVEAPKYKKSILESEIRSSNRYEKFKNDTDIVLEDISKYVNDKYGSIEGINKDAILEITKSISKHKIDIEEKTAKNISSLNETLDKVVGDLEKKINLVSDNKDEIFEDLSKKIVEVKKLKRSVNKDLKLYEDHKNIVENKISDLEVEIVRSKSNLKEQNKEFVKVQKNVKTNFNSIREEFKTVVDKLNLDNLEEKNNELSKKVRYLEEVFAKFNEKEFLSEGLLNIPPETDNSDPLTPLDKKFVTLDQLQNHYRLFLNRIQQQLATFGGGGETQLKYLDDVVGIATNPAAYDGGYLRYVHSLKKFAFSSPSDGDTWIQGVDGPYTMGRVGIGTSLIQSGDYPDNALVVEGNARITGILTIGTASITLNADTGSISSGEVEVVSPGGGANFVGVITAGGANFTGDVSIGGTLTYEDVKNVDSIGIITANKDVRVGRNFNVTGLSTFTGITTFSDDVYVGGDLNVLGDIVYDEVSGRNLNVTGVSTLSNLIVSGIASFTSSSHTKLPSGTTAQRPASAVVGDIRYNTQTNQFEGYKGSSPSWSALGGGGSGSPGGSNTEIQFNNSDSFEGDANLTFDGSKLAVGVDLDVDGHTELDDVNVSGVATIGNVTVGGATTDLLVEGDARVTGILKIGTSSLILDGSDDKINVGSATTIESTGYRIGNSFVHSTGISADDISASSVSLSGDLNVTGISTLGVVTSGTWNGTAITNSYISSATTWNAKQDALTFGLSSGNALKSEEALSTNDILLAGTSQIKGRTYTELKSDLSLDDVENTALSTWAGSTKITSVGIIGIGTWQGTALNDAQVGSATTWNAKQDALTFGIADTNALNVDDASVGVGEYTQFTASGVAGVSTATLKSNLSLDNVENTALSTWGGSSNITTVGTLNSLSVDGDVSIGGTLTYEDVTNVDSIGLVTARSGIHVGPSNAGVATITSTGNASFIGVVTAANFSGIWSGTSIADSYVASATTWNNKQDELTFGIANTNVVKINDVSVEVGEYAQFTATGVAGVSTATLKSNLSLNNVENTALSTWAGTTNITTLGTIATGTWQGTALNDAQVGSATTWNSKISEVVEDTAPQLGGNLDGNSKDIYGVGIITANSIDAAISEWVLGANGSSDYTFTGPGLTGAENDPTIYLKRGQKYRFKNTMGAHGFRIQSTINGSTGTQYNDGITNNDVSNGTLIWDVQFDAPDVLYYQCVAHDAMGGKIYIGNSGDSLKVGTAITATAGIITSNTIHLKGGDFGPIDGGSDDETDAALVIDEGQGIYTLESSGGWLIRLLEKQTDIITIGQANTNKIDGIELIPGKSGTTKLFAGDGTATPVGILTANQSGVEVSGILTTTQIADGNGSVGSASSVLSSTGSGLEWVAQSGGGGGGGISLSDLSVGSEGTASGDGALAYDNSTGVFTYTPADTVTNATNVEITDDTSGSGTHYLHFGSATSSNDGVEVDSTGLVYKDGKLGIGTAVPSATSILHLRTSANQNLEFEETSSKLRISALNDARSSNVDLQFAASEFNFLTGNVGIGTDNPTGANALTNNEVVLAVGVATANTLYGKLNNLTYPTTNGTDGQVLTSDGAGVVQWEDATGGGGGSQNLFQTIAVSGQSDVVAESTTDTLTLVAGSNMTITTNATGDSVTFASSGGGGGGGVSEALAIAYAIAL